MLADDGHRQVRTTLTAVALRYGVAQEACLVRAAAHLPEEILPVFARDTVVFVVRAGVFAAVVEEANVVVLLFEWLDFVFDELVELAQKFLDIVGNREVHEGPALGRGMPELRTRFAPATQAAPVPVRLRWRLPGEARMPNDQLSRMKRGRCSEVAERARNFDDYGQGGTALRTRAGDQNPLYFDGNGGEKAGCRTTLVPPIFLAWSLGPARPVAELRTDGLYRGQAKRVTPEREAGVFGGEEWTFLAPSCGRHNRPRRD